MTEKLDANEFPWIKETLKEIDECNTSKDLAKRKKAMIKEYEKTGICSMDMWSLDMTIAQWIVPRLKRFRELPHVKDVEDQSLAAELDKMIYSFETIASFNHAYAKKEVIDKVQEGLQSFADNIWRLWC